MGPALVRRPRCQIFGLAGVEWPRLDLKQNASWLQGNDGVPRRGCYLSTRGQVFAMFLCPKENNVADLSLLIKSA